MAANAFVATLPTNQAYTVIIESRATPIAIELRTGTDTQPTNVTQYLDLSIPAGVNSRLKITPQGIEDLQYDLNDVRALLR